MSAASAIATDYTNKLTALRASVPNKIKEIDGILTRHFGSSLDEVMNKSRQALSSNNEIAMTLSVVRETLVNTASDLELLVTWLKLKIPKIEDGGNFGVVSSRVNRVYEKMVLMNKGGVWAWV